MKKVGYTVVLAVVFGLLPLLSLSCNRSNSCGDDDKAKVYYDVEIDGDGDCLDRLEWIDEDGILQSRTSINGSDWGESFCTVDGAHLYLHAEIDCDEVEIKLYINNSLVENETDDDHVTIDGYLSIDDEGNATFTNSAD